MAINNSVVDRTGETRAEFQSSGKSPGFGNVRKASREGLKERRTAMRNTEEGKVGWVLLWLLGIPIPILVVLFVLRGCT